MPFCENSNSLVVPTQYGKIRFSLNAFGLRLRTDDLTNNQPQKDKPAYNILIENSDNYSFDVLRSSNKTELTAGNYKLILAALPTGFSHLFYNEKIVQQSATDGHFSRRYQVPPFAKTERGWFINLALSFDESVYGLGEKWSRLDKRGQLVRSYNYDALGVNGENPIRTRHSHGSLSGWNVFVHTASPVTHSVGYASWSQRAYCR